MPSKENVLEMLKMRMPTPVKLLLAGVVAIALAGAASPAARADFSIIGASASLTGPDGTFSRQAGAHPDFRTHIAFSYNESTGLLEENVKDVRVDMPPGLVGDPTASPTCPERKLVDKILGSACPAASRVGTAWVSMQGGSNIGTDFPLFNMERSAGTPGLFGFTILGVPVLIRAQVRPGDYGISALSVQTPQTETIYGVDVLIWGVPADHGVAGATPRTPFFTSSTSCPEEPSITTISANSWQNPGALSTWSLDADVDGTPFVTQGCERLAFDPTIGVQPSSRLPDAPTGLDIDLTIPQNDNPDGLATAHLKDATVAFPEGLTLNPGAADGLAACTDGQLRLGTHAAVECPDASKLGTVTAVSPALDDPLSGSVYLGEQRSGDPESGEMFRLFMVLDGPGFKVKLRGQVRADAQTGRLKATFDNNPQLPVSNLHLEFFGGARGPLVNPRNCGTYTTTTDMTSWSGRTVHPHSTFTTVGPGSGGECLPPQFKPGFTAGTQNPIAGAHTPFVLRLTREDVDDELKSVTMQMPPGLLGTLNSTTLCSDADVAADSCPDSSRIGSVAVGSGAGSNPFFITNGRAYMTGPYNGAPFGIAFTVPAVAGPFDLGKVIVRSAVRIDRKTAQLSVVSDPLPTILGGVPLQVRDVRVAIDRPGFIFNPTDCSEKHITGTIGAVTDRQADVSERFQVGDCASLGYSPKLSLTLTGKGQTTDGKHPALKARLLTTKRQANTKKAKVTLPLSLALDPYNAQALCKPEEFAARNCPKTSIVGKAKAVSVLHVPLEGPVYFVEGLRTDAKGRIHRTLPKLWIPLVGEGVTIDINASSQVVANKLVTTFDLLPDAPFSSFDLSIDGGKYGILVVSNANLCAKNQVAATQFDGHNGRVSSPNVRMKTPCTAKQKKAAAKKKKPAKKKAKKTSLSGF